MHSETVVGIFLGSSYLGGFLMMICYVFLYFSCKEWFKNWPDPSDENTRIGMMLIWIASPLLVYVSPLILALVGIWFFLSWFANKLKNA